MDLQLNNFYSNKTRNYLHPCLKTYGDGFLQRYTSVFKLAVGIYDYNTSIPGRNLFILVDKAYQPRDYIKLISFLQYQEYFVTNYSLAPDVLERKEMIVLKVPKEFYTAYDKFLLSQYSQMYTPAQLKFLFNRKEQKPYLDVCLKTEEKRIEFQNLLNEDHNTFVEITEEFELDVPLKRAEEIYHCPVKKETYYANTTMHIRACLYFDIEQDKIWDSKEGPPTLGMGTLII